MSTTLTQQTAARELLASLLNVKGWFRESSRWAYPQHSTASLLTLGLLDRCGPSRVGALAEVARLDVSVVSRQLAQLEQSGLVTRRQDPDDGRAHLVSLSDQGRAVLAEGYAGLADGVAERLAHWPPDELTELAATLQRLLDDLEA